MPHMKKTFGLIIILFLVQIGFAQSSSDLTAEQIVNLSINQIGGIQKLKTINTSELAYAYINENDEIASIVEKRNIGKNFTQSILSENHFAQTTFFDGKSVVKVDGENISKFNLEKIKDEVRLKTYNHLQFGYKQLNFSLVRLKDENFKNFDCYVVNAKSKNGYSTINFFDKVDFKLVMVVYPSGDKSLLIEQIEKDGIMYNSHILNTNKEQEISNLKLLDVKLNQPISEVWFHSPYSNDLKIQQDIKIGTFKPANSNSILTRNESEQTETYGQNKVIKSNLTWKSNDTFILKPKDSQINQANILVRIVSWNENEYVCHYKTEKAVGTQEYTRAE
jgi:hypothetical protein